MIDLSAFLLGPLMTSFRASIVKTSFLSAVFRLKFPPDFSVKSKNGALTMQENCLHLNYCWTVVQFHFHNNCEVDVYFFLVIYNVSFVMVLIFIMTNVITITFRVILIRASFKRSMVFLWWQRLHRPMSSF